jgi:hypothetical protein
MKRGLILAALAVLVAWGAAALDFGGSLDSATTVEKAADGTFDEEATVAGWVRQKLGDTIEVYVRGSYTYTIDTPVLFDLDAAWLKGEWDKATGPTLLELTLGRFKARDFTHLVLDHTVDGIEAVFTYPRAVFRATAGYTGLVQKPRSDIVISRTDATEIDDKTVLFAPPRLLGVFDVDLLNVLGDQTLKLAMLLQEDLRPDSDLMGEGDAVVPSKGGRLSTQYLGASIGGPMGGGFYYDLFAYGSTGQTLSDIDGVYRNKPIAAVLAGGGVRLYAGPKSSVISLRGLYASGDKDAVNVTESNTDGFATTFTPISLSDTSFVFSPQLSNIIVAQASYSLVPFESLGIPTLADLQAVLSALAFARPTTGPVSSGGIDPASDAAYLGAEIDLTVNYRPFSDLGIALKGGVFFPNESAFVADRTDPAYLVGLVMSLSF